MHDVFTIMILATLISIAIGFSIAVMKSNLESIREIISSIRRMNQNQ